ncbi:DUF262 domain-containing protein [bacterium]|jgi:uncharacterized protein with ParB-like and HNH nuclease domain|nr:DUF262 domain-containing protein [bacterium]
MSSDKHKIKSEKILVKDIFSNLWFRVPEYQRPYVWGNDQIDDLLDDLTFALEEKPKQDYFLGSFVYQIKRADRNNRQDFDENDLLDGQQRITTLFLLFACIRDLSDNDELKESCQHSIYQKGDKYDAIPERIRLAFAVRPEVQDFVDKYIKVAGGTDKESDLESLKNKSTDPSTRNMANGVLEIRQFLQKQLTSAPETDFDLQEFYAFIRQKVLMIYVATENLDDAFRLFTILNDRGMPLRNSDILKATNLGVLTNSAEKEHYAKMWEKAEGDLGDDFDRFLSHIRTILLKDKARLNLLDEFEQKIYLIKDKSASQQKLPLLEKGKATFVLVERYLDIYNQLLSGSNYDEVGNNFQFDNLIKVMLTGLPSTDWLPPLMRYFERFKYSRILEFLTKLDNQLSSDWIAQYSPTARIERMNSITRAIEAANSADELLDNKSPFIIDEEGFSRAVESAVYGRRFTRYLLLKLDYLYMDHLHRMSFQRLSVEHILPQNPNSQSQWRKDFTDNERQEWTHRLGNLVLITTIKNTSQGNLDFAKKKKSYFKQRINTCPNSLRVLNNDKWTLKELKNNHRTVLNELYKHYGIACLSNV